ncbi:hypothetical protein [uncultured Litoreibacter sp.]|uniref:hypothetical protein n=1 Tax=uncultured Litoreibacter sp. TaxID=1392394 RepID=UPI002604A49E|nr:hypothetical protein [uncultured Litoreibacter sp.]
MRRFVLAALALSFLVTACTVYGNRKRVGTFTYEGKDYPVYSAIEDGPFLSPGAVLLMYEPGANLATASPIEVCEGEDLEACRTRFGKALRPKEATPVRDEGGMGY